jgi:hypothetical protein
MRVGLACAPAQVVRDLERAPETVNLRDEAYVRRAAGRLPDIGRKVGRSPPPARLQGAPAGVLLQRGRPARRRAAALCGLDARRRACAAPAAAGGPADRVWNPAATARAGGVPAEYGPPEDRQRVRYWLRRAAWPIGFETLTRRAQVEYLLNTGNLGTGSGSNIDLSQASGFTIVAEKLNFFRRAAYPIIPYFTVQHHSENATLCSTKSTPPCALPPVCVLT